MSNPTSVMNCTFEVNAGYNEHTAAAITAVAQAMAAQSEALNTLAASIRIENKDITGLVLNTLDREDEL